MLMPLLEKTHTHIPKAYLELSALFPHLSPLLKPSGGRSICSCSGFYRLYNEYVDISLLARKMGPHPVPALPLPDNLPQSNPVSI
jgi:hypothetical protein